MYSVPVSQIQSDKFDVELQVVTTVPVVAHGSRFGVSVSHVSVRFESR